MSKQYRNSQIDVETVKTSLKWKRNLLKRKYYLNDVETETIVGMIKIKKLATM